MRPEYRAKLDAKYKDKIEKIVRKTDRAEEPEAETPCPYCAAPVAGTTLECHACSQRLPYCIVTGQHMVRDNFGQCPECRFPALYTVRTCCYVSLVCLVVFLSDLKAFSLRISWRFLGPTTTSRARCARRRSRRTRLSRLRSRRVSSPATRSRHKWCYFVCSRSLLCF
jgi:hypothetical protein